MKSSREVARRSQRSLQRRWLLLKRRVDQLDATAKGMLWTTAAGFLFFLLNTLVRQMSIQLDPFQAQFLRYLFGTLVMVPIILDSGVAAFRPERIGGQFIRGAVHTLGMCLWFVALPKIPLADMTSISLTGPIFIMIGAAIFLKEPMGRAAGRQSERCELISLYRSGRLRPVVDRRFALDDIDSAFGRVQRGEQFGKVLFTID